MKKEDLYNKYLIYYHKSNNIYGKIHKIHRIVYENKNLIRCKNFSVQIKNEMDLLGI